MALWNLFSNFLPHKKKQVKKILLVDDNKICLKSNSIIIKKFYKDLTVLTTDSGKKALDIILSQEFEFIILDLGLPDINGIQILKKLNLKKNDIKKVVILTSYNSDYFKIACKHLNAHSFIQKPLDIKKLLIAIS